MASERALRYLNSRERLGVKFGLENIRTLSRLLGDPQEAFTSVLVAGTNGKGSTAALIESILRASGLSTGRYTSPHIKDVEERIALSGRRIDREELHSVVDHIAEVAETAVAKGELSAEPTFFETLTASAYEIFRSHRVDIGILEMGLGARLDATNLVPAITSIVTPIGLDHQAILGDTLAKIAREKAAALRPGRPAVIAKQEPEAMAVVREYGESIGCELHEVQDEVDIELDEMNDTTVVNLTTPQASYRALLLPLLGRHQVENLAVAVRASELILREMCEGGHGETAKTLNAQSVREGVAATRWPGRLERLDGSPSFLLDAAHNVMAVEALACYLASQVASPRVLVFGVMGDKDFPEMLIRLAPFFDHLILTRAVSRRATEPEILCRWANQELTNLRGAATIESITDSKDALSRARELSGNEGEIVISGSIYLLGELRPLLV